MPAERHLAVVPAYNEERNIGRVVAELRDFDSSIDVVVVSDGSLDRIYLLHPDPWPKARHHRRRFMNPENLRSLARVLRPGAELRLATDIPDYFDHALEAVSDCADLFDLSGPVSIGRGAAWSDWPGTRYEAKALRAGRIPHYAAFRRI